MAITGKSSGWTRPCRRADVRNSGLSLVVDSDKEIVILEGELRAAQLAADVQALDRLIDDDLLFAGPTGELATKADDLEAHRSGVVRFRAHEPEEMRIRKVGADVVVVALRTRLVVDVHGMTHRGTFRYTRVWQRRDGRWRIVAGHVSEVSGPGAPEDPGSRGAHHEG